jgi:hypothetical protein
VQAFVRQFDACKFAKLAADYSDFALGRCELFLHQVEQLGQELRDEFGIGATTFACSGKFFYHKMYSGADHMRFSCPKITMRYL